MLVWRKADFYHIWHSLKDDEQKKRIPVLEIKISVDRMARDSALSATLPESGGQERSWHKSQADANTAKKKRITILSSKAAPEQRWTSQGEPPSHSNDSHLSTSQLTNHEAIPAHPQLPLPPLRLPTNLQRSISNPSKQPQPPNPPPQ